jgi:hypothetical protein
MAKKAAKSAGKVKRQRKDGRRSFLAYLDPNLIRDLKIAAIDRQTPAYLLVESALRDWLANQPKHD